MLDGNTFFPDTGIPIRKIACMMRLFALAEPVPLTVAILKAKSLTELIGWCEQQGGSRFPVPGSRNWEPGTWNPLLEGRPQRRESECHSASCPTPLSGIARHIVRSAGRRPR